MRRRRLRWACSGAMAYFLRDVPVVAATLPEGHKYLQLLAICVVVLIIGFASVLAAPGRVAGHGRGC